MERCGSLLLTCNSKNYDQFLLTVRSAILKDISSLSQVRLLRLLDLSYNLWNPLTSELEEFYRLKLKK